MENFKARRNDTYRWDNANEGHVIRVEVYYRKGGMNYWNYKQEPRGYWLSVTALEIERKEGYHTESFIVGQSGFKFSLGETARLAPKQLEKLAAKFDADAPQIAVWFAADRNEGCAKIKELVEARKEA